MTDAFESKGEFSPEESFSAPMDDATFAAPVTLGR